MSDKLGEMFVYKSLPKYEGLKGVLPVHHPNVYVGIEIELEKVKVGAFPTTFYMEEDHSLKVEGREFISIPIRAKYLEVELTRLFNGLFQYDTSVRCSTHLHMNVRDMTVEQVHKLLILYMIFEKSLFNFAGQNRWKNNFCTPLFSCPRHITKWFITPCAHWYKYFALNLSPIFGGQSKKTGTIEFRHMGGCSDVPKIISWVNLITSLKSAAIKMPMETLLMHLETMNTTSAYWWLAKEVFGKSSKIITDQDSFKEDVESCITQTKFLVLDSSIKKKLLVKPKEVVKPKETVVWYDEVTDNPTVKISPNSFSYYPDLEYITSMQNKIINQQANYIYSAKPKASTGGN